MERHLSVELPGKLPLSVVGEERFAGEEVLDASVDVVRVFVVGLHVEASFGSIEVEAFCTLEFRWCESVLSGTFGHTYGCDECAENVFLPAGDAEREGALCARDEKVACACCGTLYGRARLLAEFGKTVVEHGRDEAFNVIVVQVFDGVLLVVGGDVVFLIEVTKNDGLFGVFLNIDNHLFVVGHGIVDALGATLGQRNGREEFLDFLLDLIHIDIAYDDDGLQVRTVPLLVIVAQVLVWEVVDDVHRADG